MFAGAPVFCCPSVIPGFFQAFWFRSSEIIIGNDVSEPTVPAPDTAVKTPVAAGIGGRSAVGFVWMLLQTLGARLASAIGQVFLARLLNPEDFGVLSLANTVFLVALVVVQPGIEDILVSKAKQVHRWLNAAFWMSFACAILGAVGMVVAAPIGRWMYDAPQLPLLVGVLAVHALLLGLMTVPQARLRMLFQFRVLAVSGLVVALLHVLLSVTFAWMGMGALSFVLPLPITSALRLWILWRHTRPVVHRHLQVRRWRRLLPDTAALFGGRAVGTIVGQGDYVLLGLMASTAEVGIYYFAFNLSRQVVQVFTQNMSTVLLPALSTLKDEPVRQMQAALRAASILAVFSVPLCAGQAAVAEPLIRLFFGEKWVDAILVMQLLMIGTGINSASWININLLQAQGRTGTILKLQAVAAVQFLFWIALGAWWGGAVGVALASSWAISFSSLLGIYLAIKPVGGGWWEIGKIYAVPTGMSLVAIGGAAWLAQLLPGLRAHPLVWIVAVMALSIPVYFGGIRVLAPAQWGEIRGLIVKALKRGRA